MRNTGQTLFLVGFLVLTCAFGTGRVVHADEIATLSPFSKAEKIGIKVEAMVDKAKELDQAILLKTKEYNATVRSIHANNLKLKNIAKEEKEAKEVLQKVNFDTKLKYMQWQELNDIASKKLNHARKEKSSTEQAISNAMEKSRTLKTEIDSTTKEVTALNAKIKDGFKAWEQAEEEAKAILNATETAAGTP